MTRVITSSPVVVKRPRAAGLPFDTILFAALVILLGLGLVMTGSASTSTRRSRPDAARS
jgi:hypothetical protein